MEPERDDGRPGGAPLLSAEVFAENLDLVGVDAVPVFDKAGEDVGPIVLGEGLGTSNQDLLVVESAYVERGDEPDRSFLDGLAPGGSANHLVHVRQRQSHTVIKDDDMGVDGQLDVIAAREVGVDEEDAFGDTVAVGSLLCCLGRGTDIDELHVLLPAGVLQSRGKVILVPAVKHEDGSFVHQGHSLGQDAFDSPGSCRLGPLLDSLSLCLPTHHSVDLIEGQDNVLACEGCLEDSLPVRIERPSEEDGLGFPQRDDSVHRPWGHLEHAVSEEQVSFIDEVGDFFLCRDHFEEVVSRKNDDLSVPAVSEQAFLLIDLCLQQTRLAPDDDFVEDALFDIVGRDHRVDTSLALTRLDEGKDRLLGLVDNHGCHVTLVVVLHPTQIFLILKICSNLLHLVEDGLESELLSHNEDLVHLVLDLHHGSCTAQPPSFFRKKLFDHTMEINSGRPEKFHTVLSISIHQFEQFQSFPHSQLDLCLFGLLLLEAHDIRKPALR